MTKLMATLAVVAAMTMTSAAHAQARPVPPPPPVIIILPPPPPPPPPPPRIILPPPPPRIDWDQRRFQPAPRVELPARPVER